jgi:hypothetical protein
MSDKFWAVWRETGGSAPSKKHETKDEAVVEASRLAQQSNERYFVLEVVGVVAPVKFPVAYTDVS